MDFCLLLIRFSNLFTINQNKRQDFTCLIRNFCLVRAVSSSWGGAKQSWTDRWNKAAVLSRKKCPSMTPVSIWHWAPWTNRTSAEHTAVWEHLCLHHWYVTTFSPGVNSVILHNEAWGVNILAVYWVYKFWRCLVFFPLMHAEFSDYNSLNVPPHNRRHQVRWDDRMHYFHWFLSRLLLC